MNETMNVPGSTAGRSATHPGHRSGHRSGVRGDGGLRVWPLRKPALAIIAKSGLALLAIWSAAGLLFMWFLDDGPVGNADRAGAEWMAEHRTETWNSLSRIGSGLSETLVKVALVAVVGTVMVIVWRRWHDAVHLAVVVMFEASVFVLSSFIVGRDRPPVEKLDEAAPSGSFPSGHTAAAVAFYGSLYLIGTWHTRNRLVRGVLLAIAVLCPIAVGVSRTYRGMHHPIDVAAGALLGAVSIFVVRAALRAGTADVRRDADRREAEGRPLPERVLRLELATDDYDDYDDYVDFHHEQINEQINGQINGQVNGQVNGQINGPINERHPDHLDDAVVAPERSVS